MMECKSKKAQEIHALVAELNQKVAEAAKLGLTVNIRSDYGLARHEAKAYLCAIVECIPYP